jgi:hypothetical protein
MASTPSRRGREKSHPEKKIGPYPGGIGVAVWLNTIETATGPRKVRSITLSPRRYRDAESGQWRDSSSYRPGDLPALIFALERALEFVFTTPLPDEDQEQSAENDAF